MIIMLGIILTAMGSAFGSTALWIGAGLMSLAVLFSIVTLPVEFDASSSNETNNCIKHCK